MKLHHELHPDMNISALHQLYVDAIPDEVDGRL
jgi:hypothetical protein